MLLLLDSLLQEMSAKAKVTIAAGAVVCNECELKGEVTIGPRTVVHPKARILAEAGPIFIGEGNLIEEQSEIINRAEEGSSELSSGTVPVMIIGNNNVFEVRYDCWQQYATTIKLGNKMRKQNEHYCENE